MKRRSSVRWSGALLALCLAVAAAGARYAGARQAGDASPDPSSGRVTAQSFTSAALGRTIPFLAYTPPGYDESADRRYPVLYMLHGLGDSYRSWQEYGLLAAADRLIGAGAIEPLIIVLPEGETGYWVDHADGGPRWGTYVVRDLVGEVDRRYRTRADRAQRAIGGASMGGHGALQLALNNPGLFGVVGAHSVALRHYEAAPAYFGDRASFEQRDPVTLCARSPERARGLTLWLDIGLEDGWYSAAAAFHRQLVAEGVPHAWTVWQGGHTPEYWRGRVEDYLRFYDAALRGPALGEALASLARLDSAAPR
jgi:enterochelin esterase-like enzyme